MSEKAGYTQEALAIVYQTAAELRKGGHHEQAQQILDEAAEAHRLAIKHGYIVSPRR